MSRRKHPHASPASIVTPSTGSLPPPPLDERPSPDAPQPDAPQPDAPQPDAPQPDAPRADAPQPDAPDASCDEATDASVHEVESLAQGYGATDAEVAAVVGGVPADAIEEASRHCGTVRVCAGDAGALARIRAAEQPGRVGHHDAGPGRALLSLVDLGREVLADPSRADTAAAWGLTADWLASLAPVADAARRATAARLAPAAPAVDTAAQRRWRGLTVILLQRVIGAFAAGRALDPGVTDLRPRFLRGLLVKKRKAKKADAETVEAKRAKAPAEAKTPAATKPAAPADAKPAAPADAKPAPTA